MTEVYSKALQKAISVERIIAKVEGKPEGPTLVFFGGIHGNEAAGVFALQQVLKDIDPNKVYGTIYAISGNLKALEKGQRFIHADLNRLWTKDELEQLIEKTDLNTEEKEQLVLYDIIKEILTKRKAPFYFIDLHTTSSKTLPFITINDALINRKFSQMFPVPIVLGIEEYLSGPLLSYINSLGYVSLGFESGQHDDETAITNSISFIYLTLVFAGILEETHIKDFNKHHGQLKAQALNNNEVFEVIYLHKIVNGDSFKMKPDFKSFQPVKKGTPLAQSNGSVIVSEYNAKVFMPLYQNKGKEGFFIIRKIKPFFLKLSAVLRRFRADGLLILLPGVSWSSPEKEALQVNLRVAKYLAKPIFHLLGYRSRQLDKTHLKIYNRERVAKVDMYKDQSWWY